MITEFVAQDPEGRCCWRVLYKKIGRKEHGVFFVFPMLFGVVAS